MACPSVPAVHFLAEGCIIEARATSRTKENAMTYRGHVKKGVVVLDEPVKLPEGAAVRVELAAPDDERTLAERLKDVIGIVKGLPSDLARNHDHYAHGKPKR